MPAGWMQQLKRSVCLPWQIQLTVRCIVTTDGSLLHKPTARETDAANEGNQSECMTSSGIHNKDLYTKYKATASICLA